MKNRRYITYLLLFVSVIALMVPVIPHHHHAGGLMCLKNDYTPTEQRQSDATEPHHNCQDASCVSDNFFQLAPSTSNNDLQPDFQWAIPLLDDLCAGLLLPPDRPNKQHFSFYIESLHGIYLSRATGLRAPPSQLS